MKLSERSFPYPVIGNRDDVPHASFQATIEVTSDAENVYIAALILTSSKTLLTLVHRGAACYAMHVECSNTLFRGVYRSKELHFVYAVPKAILNDTVDVSVVAIASEDADDYSVDGQHTEYGSHTFAIRKGDILAIYPTQQFDIERDYTSFRNIDSIVTIINSGNGTDHPMRIRWDEDKIIVELSDTDFQHFAVARTSPIAQTLSAAIVLPIIIEALNLLRQDGDELDYRWSNAIRKRIAELGKTLDEEPLILAQYLLELPIKRALSSAASVESE